MATKRTTKKAAAKKTATKKAAAKKVATKKAAKAAAHKPKKGKKYMNKQQLKYFTGLLEKRKKELMQEVDHTVHHMQDDTLNLPDPLDRASQEAGFSVELRTRDRERKLIRKIDATLEKIKQSDYGYCVDCGAEIGLKRLEARPTATQCIECKAVAEIREKQIGEEE